MVLRAPLQLPEQRHALRCGRALSLKMWLLSRGCCCGWARLLSGLSGEVLSSLSSLGCAGGRFQLVPASQVAFGPLGGQIAGACRGRCGADCCVRFEWLLEREDVPAGDQDFARDGGLDWVWLAESALGLGVELVPGIRRPPGRLCCLDSLPSAAWAILLWRSSRSRSSAQLLDRGREPGVADHPAGARETGHVADLSGDREREQIADPRGSFAATGRADRCGRSDRALCRLRRAAARDHPRRPGCQVIKKAHRHVAQSRVRQRRHASDELAYVDRF